MSQADAARLIDALWEPLDSPGLVELRPIGPDGPVAMAREWLTPSDAVRALPSLLPEWSRRRWHTYFGVLPRIRKGGTIGDVGDGAVVWVDLDTRPESAPSGLMSSEIARATAMEAHRRLNRVPWQPSAVVLTGGGAHAYWVLSEPELPHVCANLSRRMAAVVGGDMNACDIARILRLPGSLNHKYRPEYPARIAAMRDGGYHAADLDDELPEWMPSPGKRTTRKGDPLREGAVNRAALRLQWTLEPSPTRKPWPGGRVALQMATDGRQETIEDLAEALGGSLSLRIGEVVDALHAAELSGAKKTVRHVMRGLMHGAASQPRARRLRPTVWAQSVERLARARPDDKPGPEGRRAHAFKLGALIGSEAAPFVWALTQGDSIERLGGVVLALAVGTGWARVRTRR